MLNDDVALQIYLETFRKYLWGMLHRIIFSNDRSYAIFDYGGYDTMVDLMYGVSLTRVLNVKAFLGSCLSHEIKRINNRLEIIDNHSCYMDDSDTFDALIASNNLKDDYDPSYWDAINTRDCKLKETIQYNLSSKQKRAVANVINGNESSGFANDKQYHNALYQARKKIKEALENQ